MPLHWRKARSWRGSLFPETLSQGSHIQPLHQLPVRDDQKGGAKPEHKGHARKEHGPDVPGKEDRLKRRVEMPRGDGQRKVLQRVGHTVDVKNEPGQDDGGQKAGDQPGLGGKKLLLGENGNEQPLPKRRHEEGARQDKQGKHRSAQGNLKQEHPGQRADGHGKHAEEVIRDKLSEQDLHPGHGRGEKGFHRSPLVLAGNDQGREHGPDERHDDGDGAGHQIPAALRRRVEPVARGHVDGLLPDGPAGRAGLLPVGDDALAVAAYEVRRVGLASRHDHLNGGDGRLALPANEQRLKVVGNDDEARNHAVAHHTPGFGTRPGLMDPEVRGVGEIFL